MTDGKLDFVENIAATNGAKHKALEYINEASDILFRQEKEENGVVFGDLVLLIDGKHVSLTDELIKNRILAENELMFWKGMILSTS